MTNTWFRMYAEFASDPKVQRMSEVMQRRLVMVFCLRCCDVTVTASDDDMAFQLRISDEDLKETKALFVSKNFIDSAWNVTNWNKRQYRSDSSAARTREYRARKRDGDVTSRKRHSDVLEQNRTEQITKSSCDDLFERFWMAYPRHTAKQNARKAWEKLKLIPDDPRIQAIRDGLARAKTSREWTKDGGQFIPHAATWLNGARWADEYTAGVVVPLERKVAL